MITWCDVISLKNCVCSNVISQSLKRIGHILTLAVKTTFIWQKTSPNHVITHRARSASSGESTFAFHFLDTINALKSSNGA